MSHPKVRLAYLQSGITVAAMDIQMATALSAEKFPGLSMLLRPDGLVLLRKNFMAWVPSTNVKVALLEALPKNDSDSSDVADY